MEMTSITAAIASVKKATDIVAALSRRDVTLEKAELKLRLAEVVGDLAEARLSLVQASEALNDKEEEIQRLAEALRIKDSVIRHGDAYYSIDAGGAPTGEPYCLHCWESAKRLCHLIMDPLRQSPVRICPQCQTRVDGRRSYLPG